MLEIIKEIEQDWFLIHLKDTRHYQIWNKWDLYEVLLNATSYSANNRKSFLDLYDEDFPMTKQDLNDIVGKLKTIKQQNNNKNNN